MFSTIPRFVLMLNLHWLFVYIIDSANRAIMMILYWHWLGSFLIKNYTSLWEYIKESTFDNVNKNYFLLCHPIRDWFDNFSYFKCGFIVLITYFRQLLKFFLIKHNLSWLCDKFSHLWSFVSPLMSWFHERYWVFKLFTQ
jgi:hypothetical protein